MICSVIMQSLNILLCLQSAMGFEYKGEVQQHASQKGKSSFLPSDKKTSERGVTATLALCFVLFF